MQLRQQFLHPSPFLGGGQAAARRDRPYRKFQPAGQPVLDLGAAILSGKTVVDDLLLRLGLVCDVAIRDRLAGDIGEQRIDGGPIADQLKEGLVRLPQTAHIDLEMVAGCLDHRAPGLQSLGHNKGERAQNRVVIEHQQAGEDRDQPVVIAAAASHANEEELDQGEIIKLLEEEMLQAAKNLEFERAAQLRDKLKEMQGAPTIKSGAGWAADPEEVEAQRIWQPKSKGRKGKRAAK